MQEIAEHELLAQYVRNQSEVAFAALVQRYVNLVYSAALRHVGNPHQAEEITQAVFITLTRKAQSLSRRVILSGWLYQTTRLTAANFLRTEIRRARREQKAHMQSPLNEPETDEAWQQIAPLLDEAMGRLAEKDRNAVVLRFFDGKSLGEVGAVLGVSEDAAKMRVARALQRLRRIFAKRGVTLTPMIIAGAVSANSIQAGPVALMTTVVATAVQGSAAPASTLALVKGVLKLMAWTKAKLAIAVGAGVLLTAGITTVAVQQANKNDQKSKLPPEAIAQLQKQKAALKTIYLEFTKSRRGTIKTYNYNAVPTYTAYYEGNHFYRHEKIPNDANYDNEVAFDGQTMWWRQNNHVIKSSLADDIGVRRHFLTWEWPYLDAAGVYAPTYIPELERFSALEPLVLRYLEHGDSVKIETVGENLRVTLRVEDVSLANMRQIELGDFQRYQQPMPNTPEWIAAETENLKKLRKMKPTRTISFLLDSQHGYAVAEREEWTAAGERIGRIVSDDWKFYDGPGIWLPGRCVASYYMHPLRLDEASNEPVLTVTHQLNLVEFGKKNISFAFEQPKPGLRGR